MIPTNKKFNTFGSRGTENSPSQPAWLLVTVGLVLPVLLIIAMFSLNELQVFAAVIGLVSLILILSRPFFGLLFFIGLIYVRPEDMFPALAGMRFTLIVSVVTLFGFWLQLFLNREHVVRTPFIGMIAGFGLMTVLSSVAGGDPVDALQDNSKLIILILLILNLVRTPGRYLVFRNTVLAFTVYLALYSAYLFQKGAYTLDTGIARAAGAGVFGNPNDLACAIVPGIGLALLGAIQSKGAMRLPYIGMLVVMINCILLTSSRGGLLGMLTVFGSFFVIFARNKGRAIALSLGVAAMFLTVAHGRITNFDHKETSANSRFQFWANGMTQLEAHPLTGIGYRQFPHVNGGMNAHNTFVICFAELGLPGYYFWLGSLYYCFRRPHATEEESASGEANETDRRELLGSRLTIAGFLVPAFFGNFTYIPITYVLFSLPIAYQIAVSRSGLCELTPQQRWWDSWVILCLCMGSLVVLKAIVPFLM